MTCCAMHAPRALRSGSPHRLASRAVRFLWRAADRKTTLMLQAVDTLPNLAPAATSVRLPDHPVLAGVGTTLSEAWREREPRVDGNEYLF